MLNQSFTVVSFLFCAFVAPFTSSAQVLYGSLTGNVTDKTGAAVPNAKVEAVNAGTGVAKQATTDDRGVFLIQDVQAGIYKLTIGAPAFASVVESGVQVAENTVRRVDVELQLANVGQTVTVAADAAVLQTDRADVNHQITTEDVADLPLTGTNGMRNFESIFVTVPGFTPPVANSSTASNPTQSQAFYVNGSSMTSNNMKLDGASDVYPWLPQIASYIPPAEAIQTVNIVTNSFSAEQGNAAGSAISATIKSGTNQFHGAGWEYNTNDALVARNFFYYQPNEAKNILNQFGVDLGGPIKKNKLFFFGIWERSIQRTLDNVTDSVAPTAIRGGDFSGISTTIYNPSTGTSSGTGRTPFPGNVIPTSMISSAAAQMATLLPQPNINGTSDSNNYFAAADLAFTRDNIDLKVNYNATQKLALFARYSVSPSNIFDPQALGTAGGPSIDGGQPGNGSGLIQTVSIGGTYTISPTVLLDGNSAFTRLNLKGENTDINQNFGLTTLNIPGTNGPNMWYGGIPDFNISNYTAMGNTNASNPFWFRDGLWVESGNLSWVKGSHNFRFGGEFFHFSIIDIQANSTVGLRGGFSFTGGLSALSGGSSPNAYNTWADFLLGLPTTMQHDYQYIDPAAVIESVYSAYARDQWQVSRKLTVTYGIRYELYPYAHAQHGIDGIHYDIATNTVELTGTNVSTGHGYVTPRVGVAYRLDEKTVLRAGYGINTNSESFRNNVQTYPEVISATYTGANTYTAAGSLVTGIPALIGPNLSAGSVPLPPNYSTWVYPTPYHRGYSESYNVTLQRDLGKAYLVQAAYVGTRDVRPTDGVNLNAAPPNGGKAGQPYYQLYGNSNSIQDMYPIDESKYNALQTKLTHRMGRLNLGVAYTFSKAMDAADNEEGSSIMWEWAPIIYRNYALTGYDRTHNFQTFGNYALPFGKGTSVLNHGFVSQLVSGWQTNWVLSKESGTPFSISSSATSLNSPGNSQTANQVLPTVAILGGHGPGDPYFDPTAFAAVTTPTFGNSGRDIIRGPGVFNLNASVFRTFSVRERFKTQFRAEALGLTNTPQFGNPSATAGSSSLGIISSASGARQIRFGVKLTF
jgi:Carboxypeptidase regulatory-like domain